MRKHNSRSPYNAHHISTASSTMPNKPIRGRGCGFSKKYDTSHDDHPRSQPGHLANDRRRIFYNTKAPMKDADTGIDSTSPS